MASEDEKPRKFFARFTDHPEEDIQRGWTGRGNIADSPANAMRQRFEGDLHVMQENLDEEYYGMNPYYIRAEDRDPDEPNLYTDDDLMVEEGEKRGERAMELAPNQWTLYDHAGITGYAINAGDERSARSIARRHEDRLRNAVEMGDDQGYTSVGEVRWHGPVNRTQMRRGRKRDFHLFSADDVVPENDVRAEEGQPTSDSYSMLSPLD